MNYRFIDKTAHDVYSIGIIFNSIYMDRKASLTLAVILLIGGLICVGYAVERYNASSESYSLSDSQAEQANELESTDIERATQLMEFSADNAAFGNKQRNNSYLFGGVGVILVIAGGLLMRKRQQ